MLTEKCKETAKKNSDHRIFFNRYQGFTPELRDELEHSDPTRKEFDELFGSTAISGRMLYDLLKASRNWTFPE